MDKKIMEKLDEIISRLKVVEGEIEKLKRAVSGKNYFPWREPRPYPPERPHDPYPYDPDRTKPYSPEDWRKRGRNPKKSDDEDDDDDGWGGIAPRQGR